MSEGKRLAEISEVREKEDGVIVQVVEESVSIAKVEEIVENCKTGRCDCMTESTKQKVEFIQVKLVDNKPAIEIKGKVSKEEIEEALSRSKKIIK